MITSAGDHALEQAALGTFCALLHSFQSFYLSEALVVYLP